MQWSMPPQVLKIVAALLGLTALAAFTLAVVNAPQRGRLPGQRAGGETAAPLQAVDATPLSEERIEGPPPPPELTPEQKAKLEADKKRKEEEAAAAALAAQTALPGQPAPAAPAPAAAADRVGDLLESVTPKQEEPLY